MLHRSFAPVALASAVVAWAGAWLPAAHAQSFRVPNQPLANQPGTQTQVATIQTPAMPGFNPAYPPVPSYPGYGGFYPGRVGGALYGVAAVTDANAQYQNTIQQARITQQQANQAAYDTRHRALQEWQYEQSLRPKQADLLEDEYAQALKQARNTATSTQIWSGTTFNTLLKSIQNMQGSGLRGPLVPLDEETLRHINLTTGTTTAGPGLFRDGGKLQWPLVLRKQLFAEEKAKITELAPVCVKQAMSGEIADGVLVDLTAAVDNLRNKVDGYIKELSPTEYVQASRYVNELKNTVKAMQDPNVTNQFNGKYSARGENVAQLVDYLTKQGLKFAPANPGDEPAYTALYQSMRSYDMGLTQLAYRYSQPNGQPK